MKQQNHAARDLWAQIFERAAAEPDATLPWSLLILLALFRLLVNFGCCLASVFAKLVLADRRLALGSGKNVVSAVTGDSQ